MSDEFLKVAKQEIQSGLDELERIIMHCNNDDLIFKNSKIIETHLHKISGLAPMAGQEKVGQMAKTMDNLLKHIINSGTLSDSCHVVATAIDEMKKAFHGLNDCDVSEFRRRMRDRYPDISNL